MKLACALACVTLIGCVLPSSARADDFAAVEKPAAEWARLRTETVRLQTEWEWQRQLLESTTSVLNDQARKLTLQRDELRAKTATDRAEIAELAQKNAGANTAVASADGHLKQVVAQLNALRPSLPPRLSQALELPFRSLTNPTVSPGERMQYVTTILNRCAQFNRTVTYSEDPVPIPGSAEPKVLEVLYWGLAEGYALDRAARKIYVGLPRDGAWKWEPSSASAEPLQHLIAIYQEKADPAFVSLPVQISHRAGAVQP